MIKIPHKVRIKGRIFYEVVWVDRFDDPECGGLCHKENRMIYLLKGLSDSRTTEVFIHEVLHAMEFEWGIVMPHRVVEQLEQAIVKLLKLNGWMPK